MNKTFLLVLAVIALAASIGMKIMSKDAALTELEDFWWTPLPLALILLILANRKAKV
ncbi:MAG: hypothetical protein IPQ08_14900 [Chitinophagaceae bacterium]|nr:hypothetical protein [Chitinophagaceae bacterium]